jgi:vancomycin resistance protein YoaR
MFKGVVIKPGEQFSFNKISGPRTRESGFREAPEYINHRIIIGYGGGSCQVSTTIYNAALLSGMRIDRRTPHSRVVEYVPFGRDATVNYTSGVDFRFTNVLKHPVMIWSRSDTKAGWLTFEIFGNPDDRQNIEITNSYTRIIRDPSAEERIIDRSLPPGKEVVEDKGTNGIRVRTWRHFIQPDGTRITEDLFYDVIAPVSRIIRYNPDTGGNMGTSVSKSDPKKTEPLPPGEVYF